MGEDLLSLLSGLSGAEGRDRFDVVGIRKEVEQDQTSQLQTLSPQTAGIATQRCGVTRDVAELLGRLTAEGIHHCALQTTSWRVGNHEIHRFEAFAGRKVGRGLLSERDVGDPGPARVGPSVRNRRRRDFDAHDRVCQAGQRQAKEPTTTVEVDDTTEPPPRMSSMSVVGHHLRNQCVQEELICLEERMNTRLQVEARDAMSRFCLAQSA